MKLGKFEILGKIGQGAMGIVYKAHDPFIGRTVALKTITTSLAESPDLLKRFYGEAQSAGRLQHPNIVTIFELGNEGETPFIAMEFLSGESLDKLIARRPKMPLSQKLGHIVSVCRALEYAHNQNPSVIHRDIKPGNVMVTADGTVKVVDFGIARLGDGTHSQSSGMLIGTLGYMSPQQFRGGSADARSDIWATGIMLYELLCYHPPFEAETPGALMTSIMTDPHRPITEAAPGTPAGIGAIIDRMLCKELDGRYQTMEEVLMDLEPVWHQVQQAEVSSLVADSRQLFEARDFAKAEDIVRKALQLDTNNLQAKSLLEKINAELRRSKIIHQVKARVENGKNLLSAGQVEEAKAEVEAALRLDSTFQPALELFDQVKAAVERVRLIANALRTSKQRLAEGAITEAELQLDKVLDMDPGNSAAQALLQQIRDEKSRRDRQARLADTLRRARAFWTNLKYEECIHVLLDAEKEFPGESEIARLLATAREDQAEQQRQSLLSEARRLLSEQRFEETLQALDRFLERFSSDPTARNLRTLALQGQEEEKRKQRLNESLKSLRALIEKGKYQEVIDSGQTMLQEFPDEFELVELIQFARSEQIQNEQKRRLGEWINQIQQSVRDERFPVAIQAAQKALKEFPQNVELMILFERAKKGQADKERENLLRQRLQEVEKRIERQELTEAIDLARNTLVTVGPHPGLAKLLHRAEMEFEQRNKKQREQDGALEKVRELLKAGQLGEATLVVENALETRLFAKSDPRFAPLLNEIDAKKQQRQMEEALKELRDLLEEGKHAEVIEKGKVLLQELPEDLELQELVDFAQAEIAREHQRQKEKEREQGIRSLLDAGHFAEAEAAAVEAVNAFPIQVSFQRLLQEARSKKKEQEERERLRQEIERKKEQQRRKVEQERQVSAIRAVIEQGNLAEATQLLSQAIASKILESDALAKQLESEIEEEKRKEQEKKQQAQALEQKRREAREALTRGDFSSALRIAQESQTRYGSDAELGELARRSEAAVEKEKIEKANRDELFQRVTGHIAAGNISAAEMLLNNSLNNGSLKKSDPEVVRLSEQLRKLAEEWKKKRNELEQVKAVLREFIRKKQLSEVISVGQTYLDSHGFQEEIAELIKQAEVAKASQEAVQKRRQAEIQTVQGLLSQQNAKEAKQVCEQAIRQGILQPQDPDVKVLLKQVDADLKRQEKAKAIERQATVADVQQLEPAKKRTSRLPFAIGAAAVLLLAGSYGVYRLTQHPPRQQHVEDAEAATWFKEVQDILAANPHQFNKATALLNQIVASPEAAAELKDKAAELLQTIKPQIDKENDLLAKANLALQGRNCKDAILFFNQVADIQGDRLEEAKRGRETANNPSNCETDPSVILQRYLQDADQAFKKNDWPRAISLYEWIQKNPSATKSDLTLARNRIDSSNKSLANEAAAKKKKEEAERRVKEESDLWDQATAAEVQAGADPVKLDAAKKLFKQVCDYNLQHRPLADAKVAEIDLKLATIKKGNDCSQKFQALSNDFNTYKDKQDADKLSGVKGQLDQFAAAGCPQSGEARRMAEQIPVLVSVWRKTPPKTEEGTKTDGASKTSSPGLSEQDQAAIKNLIEVQLTDAFHQHDAKRIQELWPYANKTDLDKFKQMFDVAKEFSRNCKVLKWDVRATDEVEVSGSYSGEFVSSQGQRQPRNGTFDIRVVRQNGGWVIKNISW